MLYKASGRGRDILLAQNPMSTFNVTLLFVGGLCICFLLGCLYLGGSDYRGSSNLP